jgi:putative membrane protein
MMWGTDYGSGGWAMMIGTIVVTAIVIAGLVVGAVWLARMQRTTSIAGSSMSAEAILDERFARGEITEAELTQRRQVLAEKSTGPGPKQSS